MIYIYNRADMACVLSRALDPRLRAFLERRFASLVTPYGDLTEHTEWVIVEPGDTEADIAREVGFSPLIDPVEGERFGSEGFQPFWDHLFHHGGWFELSISFGSTFAYVLLIADADDVPADLRRLCHHYTCEPGPK